MKRIIQILLLISSLTCFSQTKSDTIDLVGIWKYSGGYFEYTLTLNQDSTYEYHIIGDLRNIKSQGEWGKKKNKLILNSDKQKPSETEIISKYSDSTKGVTFVIHDISGEPIGMPHIKIKTSIGKIDTLITNFSGKFNFRTIENIQGFEISFVGLKDATWTGKMNRNYFEILMAPEYENYIFQTNETWKIKNNRLYSPSSKKDNKIYRDKGRINYYLKEKTNANSK